MTRVLHFPSNTGNHPAALAAAERALGYDSTVVTIEPSPFYGVDGTTTLDIGNLHTVGRWWKRLRYAASAARQYDVFHFNKGETFIPGSLPFAFDAWWLRRKGKRVIVTFQGSDARPHVDGAPTTRHVPLVLANAVRRTRARQISKWAHKTWCLNPDLVEHVPDSTYLPYASVDIKALEPQFPRRHSGPLRVVHAPSNRAVKGTGAIEHAVEVASRTIEIELDIIENVSHDEVLARVRNADVAIDQLILGWYGGFAVECMALGKPTVAWIDPRHRTGDLPLVQAGPDSLADVLVTLASADLAELGRTARAWVQANHDPLDIAKHVVAQYD